MRLPVNRIVGTTFGVVVLAMTSGSNAGATCLPVVFGSYDHYVFTPGVCAPGPPCPGGTSVTDNLAGSFWALGFGNPVSGQGVDNGTWPAREGSYPEETGWILSPPDAAAIIYGQWGLDPRGDGCIFSECMAVLLSDEAADVPNTTYFSVSTKRAGSGGEFLFESDIVLAPIPRPHILNSSRGPDGIELTIVVNAPTAGVELDPACPQDVVLGYRLYSKMTRGGLGPGDLLRTDWNLAVGGTGPDGAPIPFGTPVTIHLSPFCGGWRYYFAASLAFEGGFEPAHLSGASGPVIGIPEDIDEDCDGVPAFTPDWTERLDCDDSDPAVYPGAPQICDHKNNDCTHPGWPSLAGTNEDGPDLDADSWRGLCDNCPADPNPSQSDNNGDGVGDACDTNDGLVLLRFADRGHVEWQEEAGFDAWNLYRGDVAVLRSTGLYTQAPGSNPIARRECGLAVPIASDADAPPAGAVALYLVTGEAAGLEGDLGKNSAGVTRPNPNPCP